ncbi:hypothetical protein P10VF_054 [Rhizobium phage vB_RleM_P10VF]|uniref:Uncharacterized protein n=1 Tax=Rhizobium phage vB_RleM_P10VF TaxID=1527770 RepID=A0A076YKI0_9CAUD|nr:hypothetical protein P10VF_054 [Rhizobium phage vB_RleM_P10VF]AIK68267.1 hypothetical protein P10VF_054 [Rhizobium phage vB_RleM_P10VF]
MATTTLGLAVTSTAWALAVDGATSASVLLSVDIASSQIAFAVTTEVPAANSDNFDLLTKYQTAKTINLAATDKIYVRKIRPRNGKVRMVLTSR